MTSIILYRICELISALPEFEGLQVGQTIYPSPAIIWVKGIRPLEVQVAEDGSNYDTLSRDGSVRRENFMLRIGMFVCVRRDHANRYVEGLIDASKNIFQFTDAIKEELDGNFVLDEDASEELLLRPLILQSETKAIQRNEYPGVLLKEMLFKGGLNVGLPSTV